MIRRGPPARPLTCLQIRSESLVRDAVRDTPDGFLIRFGHMAHCLGEQLGDSVTRLILDVGHRRLDVLVAHKRLAVDDVEHPDGNRAERMRRSWNRIGGDLSRSRTGPASSRAA